MAALWKSDREHVQLGRIHSRLFCLVVCIVLFSCVLTSFVVWFSIGKGFHATVWGFLSVPILVALLINVEKPTKTKHFILFIIGVVSLLLYIMSILAFIAGMAFPTMDSYQFGIGFLVAVATIPFVATWTYAQIFPAKPKDAEKGEAIVPQGIAQSTGFKKNICCSALSLCFWLFYLAFVVLACADIVSAVSSLYKFQPEDSRLILVGGNLYPGETEEDLQPHKLIINCEGPLDAPEPFILFEHGLGGSHIDFTWIQRNMTANNLRSCSYSRAGYSYSQRGKNPRTITRMAQDTNDLLTTFGWKDKQVLLVGHSMAGYMMRQYQATFGKDHVVGIVFLDAVNPTRNKNCGKTNAEVVEGDSYLILRPLLASGLVRMLDSFQALPFNGSVYPYLLPEDVQQEYIANVLGSNYAETRFNEFNMFNENCGVVTSVANFTNAPFLTEHIVAETGIYLFENGTLDLTSAQELAQISSTPSTTIVVSGSDHVDLLFREKNAAVISQVILGAHATLAV